MQDRRQALGILIGAPLAGALAWPGLALAGLPGERRLVVVILRGGLDGLAALPPHGDPDYAAQRGSLALPAPGQDGGALDLDGFFGLHPALPGLHELYRKGEALALHAMAPPYRGRSHFDAQDVLENGGAGPGAERDGWLNRAVAALDPEGRRGLGLALGDSVPLVLRGPAKVGSWSPSALPAPGDALLQQVAALWDRDPLLGPGLAEGLRLQDSLGGPIEERRGLRGLYGPRGFLVFAEKAGQMLALEDGPRLAVLEMGGWDTHANQGRQSGRLTNHLKALDDGLGKLKTALGTYWKDTAVVVVTEFGRTVAPNGSGGSDHGVGGAAFLLGGRVAGGRVLADWPGLSSRRLHEGRDLRASGDLRALFKAVLHDHLEIDRRRLDTDVFPESAGLQILRDSFKT